jgi:hypothetical protein
MGIHHKMQGRALLGVHLMVNSENPRMIITVNARMIINSKHGRLRTTQKIDLLTECARAGYFKQFFVTSAFSWIFH